MFEANPNSHELAEQLHSGAPEAYEFVVCSFAKFIIANLTSIGFSRQDAEEVAGDCFLKLWDTRCESYNPDRGPFVNWLLRVACNVAIDRLKTNKHARSVALAEAEYLEDPNSIEAKYSGPWDYELVERAIPSLKQNYQTVINLRYGYDLTHAEMSQILGKSPAAVGMTVRRAVQRLRTQVERTTNDAQRRRNYRARGPDSS
jgi:RNA polymerase sigma-70 factor (ECF subfamily)